jgi:hypothetical protein
VSDIPLNLFFFTKQRKCSFDLDLPLEVDDDYWESENRGPTSPNPSKPVPMTAFNRWVKLTQIIGYALGTLVGNFFSTKTPSLMTLL